MTNIKVLAISSAGGHWVQLQRISPAWDGCKVIYATTRSEYFAEILKSSANRNQTEPVFETFVAANRWQKIRLLIQLIQILWIIVKHRPDFVVSTGAASGYFALRIGKLTGAKTIWLDSIANSEELSLSGQKVSKYADLYLTQWEHLANPDQGGPLFKGAVI
ncbi:hypothetical protein [Sneathiella glossodoripedis]|uniref:hypothetical protein n=1 Tax=Sneathiella glossodoripedis TaxID=418853 RepID=UPI0004707AD9|nr:hypothetical protein [Sneathiella glossodoripedis]